MPVEDEDVKTLLERRRASYVQREKELQAELAQLQAMIRNLEAAMAVLQSSIQEHGIAGETPRMTIKEGVMQVLRQVAPRGLSALSILERLRVDLDMDYPRTSLSPQLSRLKQEGKIRLEGGVWFLNENGPGAESA